MSVQAGPDVYGVHDIWHFLPCIVDIDRPVSHSIESHESLLSAQDLLRID
jgi:hypothetical protein